MGSEPGTPRPKPQELQVGTRLRVEWSKGWWAARVAEEKGGAVRISFDTWSTDHDEWLPKDSPRLRMAIMGEKDANAEFQRLVPPPPAAPQRDPLAFLEPLPTKTRAFVPKPYNPEKEFQKRQLRLKEKIAAMQKAKLGQVDPALFAQRPGQLQLDQLGGVAGSGGGSTQDVPLPPPPVPPPPAPAGDLPAASSTEATAAPAASAVVGGAAIAAGGAVTANVVLEAAEELVAMASSPPASEPQQHRQGPSSNGNSTAGSGVGQAAFVTPPVDPSPPVVPAAPAAAATATPSAAEAVEEAWGGGRSEPLSAADGSPASAASDAPVPAAPSAVAARKVGSRQGIAAQVRWEECLTETKERYYHELSTGRTQWELPYEGWVELIADDGERYFWEPATNTTQWTRPSP